MNGLQALAPCTLCELDRMYHTMLRALHLPVLVTHAHAHAHADTCEWQQSRTSRLRQHCTELTKIVQEGVNEQVCVCVAAESGAC